MSGWTELLLERRIDRRTLIITAAAMTGVPAVLDAVPVRRFKPLAATDTDDLVLASGYRYEVVVSYGDDIGPGRFGIENDFVAFMPIDLLERGMDLRRPHFGFALSSASSTDGLLVVNHEAPLPIFSSGWDRRGPKTAAQQTIEEQVVGLSVVRVAKENGRWGMHRDPNLNRRIDGRTPMRLTGPASGLDGGPVAFGTMANCSGGVTPWGTVLSCEENFHEYPAPPPVGYGWPDPMYAKRHYGWIVEIDPFDPDSVPRKHTSLGRMRHENAAVRVAADGSVVVYMGDDKQGACFYKFVSDQNLGADRKANLRILESGRLYVGDFANGRWILLDRERDERLKKKFASQADVLADVRSAGLTVGATPLDRPEDVEIHPHDGSVYIALTNNADQGNFHGHIVCMEEKNGDPTALEFEWNIFAVGGPQSGFSSPDNLIFDDAGDLWMCTDVSDTTVGRGIYSFLGNNSLFFIPTRGADRGTAYRFASAPPGSELTGPAWTPDGSTLFLAVQHPGSNSPSLDALTSHWPEGGASIPRGSVVAISGFSSRSASFPRSSSSK